MSSMGETVNSVRVRYTRGHLVTRSISSDGVGEAT